MLDYSPVEQKDSSSKAPRDNTYKVIGWCDVLSIIFGNQRLKDKEKAILKPVLGLKCCFQFQQYQDFDKIEGITCLKEILPPIIGYMIYISSGWYLIVKLALLFNVIILSMFEPPSAAYQNLKYTFLYAELVTLIILLIDVILTFHTHEPEKISKKSLLVLVGIIGINITLNICGYPFNNNSVFLLIYKWCRIVRPCYIFYRFPIFRQMFESILWIMYQLIEMMFFLFICLITLAFFSNYFFYDFIAQDMKIGKNPYFKTFHDTLYNLVVLSSTTNYPDIILDSYEHSQLIMIYFVFLALLVVMIMIPFFFANVYNLWLQQKKAKDEQTVKQYNKTAREVYNLMMDMSPTETNGNKLDDSIAKSVFYGVASNTRFRSKKDLEDHFNCWYDSIKSSESEFIRTCHLAKAKFEQVKDKEKQYKENGQEYRIFFLTIVILEIRLKWEWRKGLAGLDEDHCTNKERYYSIRSGYYLLNSNSDREKFYDADKGVFTLILDWEWFMFLITVCGVILAMVDATMEHRSENINNCFKAILPIFVFDHFANGCGFGLGYFYKRWSLTFELLSTIVLILFEVVFNRQTLNMVVLFKFVRILYMIKCFIKFRLLAVMLCKIIYQSGIYFVFLWCCMYIYAIIGMPILGSKTTKRIAKENCLDENNVNYETWCTIYESTYYKISFNTFSHAMTTLFIFLLWWDTMSSTYVIVEGTRWIRAYLVSYYIFVGVIVIGIIMSFILDSFSSHYKSIKEGEYKLKLRETQTEDRFDYSMPVEFDILVKYWKTPEDDQPEDDQPEDDQPGDDQPEEDRPEEDQPEDNQPEDDQHEVKQPEDNQDENDQHEDDQHDSNHHILQIAIPNAIFSHGESGRQTTVELGTNNSENITNGIAGSYNDDSSITEIDQNIMMVEESE